MKKPALKDLNEVKPIATDAPARSESQDRFRQEVKEQTQAANITVRKTYSLERFYADHIDGVAAAMTQAQGKVVNASQALRAILKRDMERGEA